MHRRSARRAGFAAVAAGAAVLALTGPAQAAGETAGGDPVQTSSGARCAVGFNLTGGSTARYALTAGQCAGAGDTVSPVGTVVSSVFPGGDYALVRYDDPAQAAGGVRQGAGLVDITGARNPVVGERGCVGSPTSGLHCGTVRSLNITVAYPEGVVSGLAEVNVCTEPGSLGAPFFDGNTALGIVVGSNGDCTSGGDTFIQPIMEPLSAYGLSVL